jgi:hypothetical protein
MEPARVEQFHQEIAKLKTDTQLLHQRLDTVGDRANRLRANLAEESREAATKGLVGLNSELFNVVGDLSLIQVRARLEAVLLEPMVLESDDALAIARANRLDWMNGRAALVDNWRLIEFNANRLLSDLDVEFSGDVRTHGDNPADFRGSTGHLRASLEFDAPLTRLLERNTFRQQLIEYQQARRALVQFEDDIHRRLRQTLRRLKQLELNLEIQRRAVAIAIRRVDQARLILSKPVPPAEPGQPPAQFGPTATRDLVDALDALRDAQNNFMSVWLNHYAGRMSLIRDLGVMRLDRNGLWIDEPLLEQGELPNAADVGLPPAPPAEWISHLDELTPGDETSNAAPAKHAEPVSSQPASAVGP